MTRVHRKKRKYLPILGLLALIVVLQSFLIDQDRRDAPLTSPHISARTSFRVRPGSEQTEESPLLHEELLEGPSNSFWGDDGPAVGDEDGAEGGGMEDDEPAHIPDGESGDEEYDEETLDAEILSLARAPRMESAAPVLSVAGITTRPAKDPKAGALPTATAPPPSTCEVKNGDSLWRVARKYNVKIADLKEANSLSNDVVHPGMVLKIPTVDRNGLKLLPQPGPFWVYETREGDSLVDLAVKLEIPLILLVQANEIEQVYELPAGIFLRVPMRDLTTKPPPGASVGTARPAGEDSPLYHLPVKGEVVSPFGWRLHPIHKEMKIHTGIDIRARYGQPIRASRSGKVVFSGWLRGYGKTIDIRHSDGLVTRYAHCSKLIKKPGDWVRQSEVIGNVGSTGLSTGPHMHFEVRRRGRPLNPMRYLTMAQL